MAPEALIRSSDQRKEKRERDFYYEKKEAMLKHISERTSCQRAECSDEINRPSVPARPA